MTPSARAILITPAGAALLALLIAPFFAGAVASTVWVPLAWFWIALGLKSFLESRGGVGPGRAASFSPITGIFVPVHVLLAVQSIPLPPGLLRAISPGSYAAHYVPAPVLETWAPLTTSLTGTLQAWLFFAGIHGLTVILFHAPGETRSRRLEIILGGMAWVGGVLAITGLVQAASAQPHWLYGIFRVSGAGEHERGIFGPYYNRDQYSNLIAMAASVSSGLLADRLTRKGSKSWRAFVATPDFFPALALATALVLMFAASAAAGSRGGLAAIGVGVCVGLATPFLARPRLALGATLVLGLVLFGTGVPAAIERLADVDFETSRLMVWRDTVRLIEFFPVFGCGIGAFAPSYWPYQRVVRFEYWPHAHNEYLQWMLEAGLVGVAMALYWVRVAWREAPRLIRSPRIRPAMAGLLATMVHAVVEPSLRIPANAAWAGVLLACLLTCAEEPGPRPAIDAPA